MARIVRDRITQSCRGYWSSRSAVCALCAESYTCSDVTKRVSKGLDVDVGVDARQTKPCRDCVWERRESWVLYIWNTAGTFSRCSHEQVKSYCTVERQYPRNSVSPCGREGALWEQRPETALERLGKALRRAVAGPEEAGTGVGAGKAPRGLRKAFMAALRGPGKEDGL